MFGFIENGSILERTERMKVNTFQLSGILLLYIVVIPAVAANWTEYRITTSPSNQTRPDIDGNVVVWQDYRQSSSDLYAANIADPNNPVEFTIATASYYEGGPKVAGSLVFFETSESSCGTSGYKRKNIYKHNLDTQQTLNITNLACNHQSFSCYMGENDGSMAVWRQGNQIMGYEIVTDSLFSIPGSQNCWGSSVVNGNIVVWTGEIDGNYDI